MRIFIYKNKDISIHGEILQLRRGTNSDLSSIGNLSIGELFYNTDREVLQVGTGTSNITLSRLGVNTGSIEFTGDINFRW